MILKLFVFLSFVSSAAADDTVTLQAGDLAPFNGTLLSPAAVSKIMAQTDYDVQACLIEAKKEKAELKAKSDFELSNKGAELAACTLRFTEYEKIYKEQINYLERRAVQPDWVKPTIFVGGVLTGIAVVSVSAWTLEKIK